MLVDDEADLRLLRPDDSGRHPQRRHLRPLAQDGRAGKPKLLFLAEDDLMRHSAAGVTTEAFPHHLKVAASITLSYHFEPGSPKDGVTLTCRWRN